MLDALFDDVEIEDQAERRDDDADQAEDDRERSAIAQPEAAGMEQVSDQVDVAISRKTPIVAPTKTRVNLGVTRMAPVL